MLRSCHEVHSALHARTFIDRKRCRTLGAVLHVSRLLWQAGASPLISCSTRSVYIGPRRHCAGVAAQDLKGCARSESNRHLLSASNRATLRRPARRDHAGGAPYTHRARKKIGRQRSHSSAALAWNRPRRGTHAPLGREFSRPRPCQPGICQRVTISSPGGLWSSSPSYYQRTSAPALAGYQSSRSPLRGVGGSKACLI